MSSHPELLACQVNYAACVKRITPRSRPGAYRLILYKSILLTYSSILRHGLLDGWTCAGIFYLTLIRYSFGEIYAQAQAERDQTPGIRTARLAQPTSADRKSTRLNSSHLGIS